jgi:hypothetical protein
MAGSYNEWDLSVITAFITTAITIIVLTTRLLTGSTSLKSAGLDKGSYPPLLPYWIPFVAHLPQFLYDPEKLLRKARYFNCSL